jgi:hypothetical protein
MYNDNGGQVLLHFAEREYVLFSFWKIGTLEGWQFIILPDSTIYYHCCLGLTASILLVMLMSILHEAIVGMRFFLDRDKLYRDIKKQKQRQQNEKRQNLATISYENTRHPTVEENGDLKFDLLK